jgi:hypothetical protein
MDNNVSFMVNTTRDDREVVSRGGRLRQRSLAKFAEAVLRDDIFEQNL